MLSWRPAGQELIFYGGPILTVNNAGAVVQALAVRDGVIVAVGGLDQVMQQRTERTVMIDLPGGALLPGFVGAHEHPTLSAVFSGAHDLSGFCHQRNVQVWSALRTAITRQTDSGRVLNAAQAIDVRQALRAMTINAAYQLGIDSEADSLEVGKWADLQIVSANPYEVAGRR